MPQPTLPPDLERALVAAALRFRAAGPRRELANADYLLVETAPGAFRVLTILGNGGSQFGLQAYSAACVGELLFLLDAWTDDPPESPVRMLELLEGECLDLVPKSETEPQDRARLAAAGLQTRAARPPCLARLSPVPPRLLFLAHRRGRRPPPPRRPRPRPPLGGTGVPRRRTRPRHARRPAPPPAVSETLPLNRPWTPADLRWTGFELPPPRAAEALPVTAQERAALGSLPRKPGEWWWIDERAQAMRIQESEDSLPWLPRLGICLDGRTGFAHPPAMGPASRPTGVSAREALAQAVKACGWLPAQLRTADPALAEALVPWTEAADVKIKVHEFTEALEKFWAMLASFEQD